VPQMRHGCVVLMFFCRLEPFVVGCESKDDWVSLEDDVDLKLTGKVALVTGSTTGIGFAIAQSLESEGAHVYVNGRTQERVDAAIAAIRSHAAAVKVGGIAADFSGSAGGDAVIAKLPAVDVLVNNVGIFEPKPFTEIPEEDWYRFFQINVMSGVRRATLSHRDAQEKLGPYTFHFERVGGADSGGDGARRDD
jgi:NAD(P)-dependent dehydrogenase (short-subunit alcohol dehydrogenase family)